MAHPEQLGKYRITGVLGEGAMGVVYRGFDPDIRRVVALKTIRHQPGHSAEAASQAAARFRNEAQAAGRLLHPGIVGVHDFGDDGRVAYIAMEYVEGHTLSAYLAQRVAFSVADIGSIAVQLLDALGHAHDNGVWHRDIKPSNIIMTRSGRIKIADFGIARTDNSGLTQANSVLGTPMYMAPEQFLGRAIDHRADLYGVGVVLYQLVAGRTPFVGPPEALMYKVVNDLPQPPSTIEGAAAGSAFDDTIAKALAKDPRQRWPNASAFRDGVVQGLGQPAALAVSAEAVAALPSASGYAPTERIPTRHAPAAPGAVTNTGTAGTPTHWDPAVLAKVEAALARHIGPLAGVLVRRTARHCHDVPELYARLGEQITQSSAREAFLGLISSTGGGSGTGTDTLRKAAAPSAHAAPGAPTAPTAPGASPTDGVQPGQPVSEATLAQAQRLLAAQVGPIAKVVVRRAAERTRERGPLFALLAESVPQAARARLLAELNKLA